MKFEDLIRTGLLLLLFVSGTSTAGEKTSSIVFTGTETAVVVNQHSNSVSYLNLSDLVEKVEEVSVGLSPQTAAYDAERQLIWITNQGENSVSILSSTIPKHLGFIKTKAAPYGVIISEQFAFISNQHSNLIQVFDKYNYVLIAEIEVDDKPRGMTLTSDGKWLYASHFDSGKISKIDAQIFKVTETISLGSRAGLTQSISIDKNEKFAYIPNTIRNTDNTSLEFDTSVFPFVSIIDLESQKHLRSQRIALDIIDEPVGLPLSSRLVGDNLFVLNAASNDISVIDIKLNLLSAHIEVGSFPVGIVQGPDQGYLYVDNSIDGSVSVIEASTLVEIDRQPVTQIPLDNDTREGIRLFHTSNDTRMAKDQWIACATCHFNGESDNLLWNFLDGLRNTPSLITSSHTGPFHWSGNLDELHDVENTIRDLQGGSGLVNGADNCTPACDSAEKNEGRSEALDNLAKYITFLKFDASATNAESTEEIELEKQRGEKLFRSNEFGCSVCHAAPLYTDNETHIISLAEGGTEIIKTPSLLDLSLSAPYYHDGRFKTLGELLDRHPADIEGQSQVKLEGDSVADLVGFLEGIRRPEFLSLPALLTSTGVPVIQSPLNGISRVSLELVVNKESPHALEISYTHSANSAFDTFLIAEHLVTAAYWYFEDNSTIKKFRLGADIMPLSAHRIAEAVHRHELPNILLDNLDLAGEIFSFHAITTERGASPYDTFNWLFYDVKEVEL